MSVIKIPLLAVIGIFLCLPAADGAPVSQTYAVSSAMERLSENPVMGKVAHSVAAVAEFPGTGSVYSVYVVTLAPAGYLIVNSDDRLPPIVSFSADSRIDLTDVPQNVFRALLLRHVSKMGERLAQPFVSTAVTVSGVDTATELFGPYLKTAWDQCNPYNKRCPDDPAGDDYHGYRVPAGCTPVAYAQVLNYHRWPLFGVGTHSYTDRSGAMTGTYSAVFSDLYDWENMQDFYRVYGGNPLAAEDAVSDLIFELCVAAETDFESDDTGAGKWMLGQRLFEHLFFEANEFQSTPELLILAMEADLRAGFPCVVAVPGHAFVADGLMVDGGVTTYHFNYGWGGENNGWWSATDIAGDALKNGVTSLRPRLMAFPQANSVNGETGESVEMRWILPVRREAEVQKLTVNRLEQQPGYWQSDASMLPTANHSGWSVVSDGRSGNAWYAGPNGPALMILDDIFVPDAAAQLTFWTHFKLGSATFTISASRDNGISYENLYSGTNLPFSTWEQKTVSLADYAGQQIRLSLALSSGSYFPNEGGVWVDDLAMSSGDWFAWKPFAEDTTLASRRFSAATIGQDDCSDFLGFEITSTDSYMDWVVSTTSGVGNCFYKPTPGYIGQEYHLTSTSTITPTTATRLLLRTKFILFGDRFRVSVSTNGSVFTEIWSGSDTADWFDLPIDLSGYAGLPIYIRLEYVVGDYYEDGGIWVDSIRTQEVTNPELEGQPVYYTILTNLVEGTNRLSATLTDTNGVAHEIGPPFILSILDAIDDGDGMPKEWEELHGLDPDVDDGGLDNDGDGFSNLEEYISGTCPTNAASFWSLEAGIGKLPSFRTIDNRLYTIQYRTNLASGIWLPLVTDLPGSNGILNISAFDSATNAARYYRVQVRLPD